MRKILLSFCMFIASAASYCQTIDDIGKIVVGVKILPTATTETLANKTYLQNKMSRIASEYGFTSYGNNAFYMTPSVVINDISIAEGGMQNVYVVSGELYLTIQEGKEGNIYASSSFEFKGSGVSKEKAVVSGLQKISYTQMRQFFDRGKERILEYYTSIQDKIFAEADMLVSNNDFDAAIACLMTVPEELSDIYKKSYSKACEIYVKRAEYLRAQQEQEIFERNNNVIVKAKSQLSAHSPKSALETLWQYSIAGTEQDDEYNMLLKKAESMISASEQAALAKAKQEYEDKKRKEEREYQDRRQEYNDNVKFQNRQLDLTEKEMDYKHENQSEITNAVKSVALAYISKSKTI